MVVFLFANLKSLLALYTPCAHGALQALIMLFSTPWFSFYGYLGYIYSVCKFLIIINIQYINNFY